MSPHTPSAAAGKRQHRRDAAAQQIGNPRHRELPDEAAEAEGRGDEPHLLRSEVKIIDEIVRQHAAEHEDAGHRAGERQHAEHDVARREYAPVTAGRYDIVQHMMA
jgi:hypothetical protein